MNTIKRKDVDREIEILKQTMDNMDIGEFREFLESRGYEKRIVSSSKKYLLIINDILEIDVRSRKYLSGRFLAFGDDFDTYGIGSKYVKTMAWVKEIVEE